MELVNSKLARWCGHGTSVECCYASNMPGTIALSGRPTRIPQTLDLRFRDTGAFRVRGFLEVCFLPWTRLPWQPEIAYCAQSVPMDTVTMATRNSILRTECSHGHGYHGN